MFRALLMLTIVIDFDEFDYGSRLEISSSVFFWERFEALFAFRPNVFFCVCAITKFFFHHTLYSLGWILFVVTLFSSDF